MVTTKSELRYFNTDLIITKVNTELSEKEIKKFPELFNEHYCLAGHAGIYDWDFLLIGQCETHKQMKERYMFWQNRLKTFYPLDLNEKEERLFYHTFIIRARHSIPF